MVIIRNSVNAERNSTTAVSPCSSTARLRTPRTPPSSGYGLRCWWLLRSAWMGGVGLPTPIASKDAEEVYNRGERSASEFVPPHGASGGSRSSNNPVVQAQTQTDLSLDRVLSPTPDSNVSRWDSVQISVEVTNPTGGSFTPRSIAWYICEEPAISAGASACQGASIDDGQSVIQGLSSTEAFTFTTAHSPSGGTGLRGSSFDSSMRTPIRPMTCSPHTIHVA